MPFTSASGVITLTTDFGLRDPFVGVLKARLLSVFPAARIVDLTHAMLAHWPAEAAFWLLHSYRYFPPGTVHVAVVDPGVGTDRSIVIVESDGHVLLAPDNGLLAPIVTRDTAAQCWRLDMARLASFGISKPSATFHGRDIVAPLAAQLAAGRITPSQLGPRLLELVPAWLEDPRHSAEGVHGQVVTIDHFGNLLTNIEAELLVPMRAPHVYLGQQILPLRRTYGDVQPGQYLALINSFGVLEVARAEGSASESLGISRAAPVVVRDSIPHV